MNATTGKSKILTSSSNDIGADLSLDGQTIEEVTSFKSLEAILSTDDVLLSRNPHQACHIGGSDDHIRQSLARKYLQLRKQVRTSPISRHLHRPGLFCETWTLLADTEKN